MLSKSTVNEPPVFLSSDNPQGDIRRTNCTELPTVDECKSSAVWCVRLCFPALSSRVNKAPRLSPFRLFSRDAPSDLSLHRACTQVVSCPLQPVPSRVVLPC